MEEIGTGSGDLPMVHRDAFRLVPQNYDSWRLRFRLLVPASKPPFLSFLEQQPTKLQAWSPPYLASSWRTPNLPLPYHPPQMTCMTRRREVPVCPPFSCHSRSSRSLQHSRFIPFTLVSHQNVLICTNSRASLDFFSSSSFISSKICS